MNDWDDWDAYDELVDAVIEALDEGIPVPFWSQSYVGDADEEWNRHCSAYRMSAYADQSPAHFNEAQWAATDEEHRIALRKKIMELPPETGMSQEVKDLKRMIALMAERLSDSEGTLMSHVKEHDEMVEKRLEDLRERVEFERAIEIEPPEEGNR